MTRKRTPLVSENRVKTSGDFAKEAMDKIHGSEKKKPGPVSFFSQWSDDALTRLLVKIPKDVKKRLKITSVNQEKTEAQVVYEILNKYLDN
jgi:hypothetical protein